MVVMASDGPSPHSPSSRFGLLAPQPSRCHYALSLLGPSSHDSRTHHVLESHPEQAAPLSRRDDERRHAIGSHSALSLHLYLAACNPSSSCRFWVLDHLCSNLSQSFHLCWITEIRSLNLCVCFTFSSSAFACLIEMNFDFKSLFSIWSLSPQRFHYFFVYYSFLAVSEIFNHSNTCAVPSVCNAVGLLILLKLRPVFTFLQQLITKNCELLTRTLFLQCSPSALSRQPQTTHVFADSRIALLCHALRICVEHAPTQSCPFFLLVQWVYRACYRSHLPLLHHASLPQWWWLLLLL